MSPPPGETVLTGFNCLWRHWGQFRDARHLARRHLRDQARIVANPWIRRGSGQGPLRDMTVCRDGHDPEEAVIRTELATYAIEAEWVAEWLPRSKRDGRR